MRKILIIFISLICFLIVGCKSDGNVTQAQTVNVKKESVQTTATRTPIMANTPDKPDNDPLTGAQANVNAVTARESSLSHIEYPQIGEHYKPFWINDEDVSDNGFEPFCVQIEVGGKITEKCGYQDDKGKISINPTFARTYIFSEGLAGVCPKIEQLCGYINEKGKLVIKTNYQTVGVFSEGLAGVGIVDIDYGKWGYIDKKGNVVIKLQYTDGEPFKNGIAKVKLGSLNYCINRKNKEVECVE